MGFFPFSKGQIIFSKNKVNRSEIVTDPADRSEEVEHVKTALRNCGYRDWTFFRASNKREKTTTQEKDPVSEKRGPTVTLPYIEGSSEQLRRAFNTAGVPTAFKPYRTLRQTLVSPKDKADKLKQSGTVYEIACLHCDSLYIGETGRKLEKRLSEHKSRAVGSKSAVNEHVTRSNNTHQIDWDNVKVLEKEPKDFPRKVLEAIHIRKKGPNLNRDKGLDLDKVWDNLINPTKTRGTRTDHQSSLTSQ